MCGISGSINFKLNIPLLKQSLYHRGPDEQTLFEQDNLQLFHHRLAILDIAEGKQPMTIGPYTIVFNGEIYNYQEVNNKYKFNLATHSDTETILHAYAKLGSACLQEFDGMFAFVIFDSIKRQLFIARDRAGKKPFYYYQKGNQFVFASELNALHAQLKLTVNEQYIQQYLRLGYFYKTATPYQDVYELPAGSYANVSLEQPVAQPTKWWSINTFYQTPCKDDFQTTYKKIDSIIHQAVRNRVESSDLEVGSFLSGGIDSGIVTAIAKEYNSSLKTFTVSFEGEYNEAPLAKLVADRYKTNHHEIEISFNNLTHDIEKILSNYGEPFFDSSAIPSYYVSEAAKKHLTVILNGDGGDELFGGYRRYVPYAKFDFFKAGIITKKIASIISGILPAPNNKKSKYNYFYRLADLTRKDSLGVYLSSTIDSFEGFEQYLVQDKNLLMNVVDDFKAINESSLSGLQKIMNLDFDNILACNLLKKMDIATMAHSMEGRSPLLSKDLLEYVPTISDSFKIKGTQTKYILRELAKKYLPEELIQQPKRGFEIPLKKWIDGELKEMIESYILSPNAYCSNFVKPRFLEQLMGRKLNTGDEKRAKMIWTLFALEVWYKKSFLSNQG